MTLGDDGFVFDAKELVLERKEPAEQERLVMFVPPEFEVGNVELRISDSVDAAQAADCGDDDACDGSENCGDIWLHCGLRPSTRAPVPD